MTATMPDGYFDRTDTSKEFEKHLFRAGRGLQSAELNEIQTAASSRLKGVADALLKNGDIIRDAAVVVDFTTGSTQCASGAIYINGAVRGVAPATFTLPASGTFTVGVRLIESVVSSADDVTLLDPAAGTRNYAKPGADRLRVHAQWGWSGESSPVGDFYPVYSVTDRIVASKEAPPNLDAVTQSLARYDRDSAGGCYVVSGLEVTQLADNVAGAQVYSIAAGRARVYGFGVDLSTSRRVVFPTAADLKTITNEPHVSTTAAAQRVNFARTPGTALLSVSITAEKSVSVTHSVVPGAADALPDSSILQIISVSQGGVTYSSPADYALVSDKVDWAASGAEPAPGSTYSVTYRYITNVVPTAVDSTGFTVAGAVTGTLIQCSYSQMLPRIDRLCLDQLGTPVWLKGVAAENNPQPPSVPSDLLSLVSINQTWTSSRAVVNDGVRVVAMPVLANVENRIDRLLQLVAQQRLESTLHTRLSGVKLGMFTDPLLDDSVRDAGVVQTASVVNGQLMLPIAATVKPMGADIAEPHTLTRTARLTLSQPLKTGAMKINPYMAFAMVPAEVTLTPSVDRWTETVTSWASPVTSRFVIGAGDQSSTTTTTSTALISSSTTKQENLRQIEVSFVARGFGAGEVITNVTFDGVSVTPVAI